MEKPQDSPFARRLERALEELPSALFLIAPDERFVFVNRAAEVLAGRARDGLVGKTIKEALGEGPLGKQFAVIALRARSGSPPVEYALRYELPSGAWFEAGFTAAVVGEAARHAEDCDVVVTGRELHAPKEDLKLRTPGALPAEVEADLRARLRQAERQMARSEKLAAVGQMAAGLVHEINAPLGALSGLVQIMQADARPEDSAGGMLDQMAGELERIRRIAENMLELALSSTGVEAETFAPVDLREVAESVLRLMEPQLKVARVRVEFKEDLSSAGACVLGSADRLKQVVMNLVLNATQAMSPPGEVPVRGGKLFVRLISDKVQPRDLPLRPSRADDLAGKDTQALRVEAVRRAALESAPPWRVGMALVRLEIEDTGPGIPEEILEKICEPFFTTKPRGEGTGLGLSTVEAIVRAHGGVIAAGNAPGGGARFTIRLPTREGSPSP